MEDKSIKVSSFTPQRITLIDLGYNATLFNLCELLSTNEKPNVSPVLERFNITTGQQYGFLINRFDIVNDCPAIQGMDIIPESLALFATHTGAFVS